MEDPLHDAGLYYIPESFEKTGQKFNSENLHYWNCE